MASLHELRELPIEGDYFLSFDDLLEVIRDASVKHKFHPPLTQVPRGRPKKVRFRKDKIRGPRGEAAAQAMAEPAGDSDDEVWSPYHCSTCRERGHFSSTCRRPHD
jgi:hypothetical protein